MPERTDEIEPHEAQIVYGVFAQGRLGLDDNLLAIYSTRERSQVLVDGQDEQLRPCLVIREIELDKHPTDTYWSTPQGIASAFHILAGLPEDFFPEGRAAHLTASPAYELKDPLGAGAPPDRPSAPTLDDVYQLALELSGDAGSVKAWLDHPLSWGGGRTPRQLVEAGRADAVIMHLRQIESGSSG